MSSCLVSIFRQCQKILEINSWQAVMVLYISKHVRCTLYLQRGTSFVRRLEFHWPSFVSVLITSNIFTHALEQRLLDCEIMSYVHCFNRNCSWRCWFRRPVFKVCSLRTSLYFVRWAAWYPLFLSISFPACNHFYCAATLHTYQYCAYDKLSEWCRYWCSHICLHFLLGLSWQCCASFSTYA